MKTIINILGFFVIVFGSFALGFASARYGVPLLTGEKQEHLPSPAKIQTLLVEQGYDIGSKGIDGWIGKDTRKAWDKAISNQYASEYDYMYKEK